MDRNDHEKPSTAVIAMSERILELVGLQKAVYDELLELSNDKKDAIVQGNVTRLDAVIAAEECLLVHLGGLEQQRGLAIETLAGQLGITPEEMSLSVIPWQDEDQRNRMLALQADFGKTLDAVRQVNEVNAQLLGMHLAYVQEVLDAATNTVIASSYDADGSPSERRVQSARIYDQIL